MNELESTGQEAVVAELEGLYDISMEGKTSVRPVSGQILKSEFSIYKEYQLNIQPSATI